MYAIVSSGGKQYKVAVGDVLEVEKLAAAQGETVALPALLLVDGGTVTTDREALKAASVSAEVLGERKAPKITIMKFKNKTGYRRRQGHRQRLTALRVTAIESGK